MCVCVCVCVCVYVCVFVTETMSNPGGASQGEPQHVLQCYRARVDRVSTWVKCAREIAMLQALSAACVVFSRVCSLPSNEAHERTMCCTQ